MNVIILAAGTGSRLGPITREIPKAAVKVGSKPLICRVVQFVERMETNRVIVVGGFASHLVWDLLGTKDLVRIENPNFLKGNLYSLVAARGFLNDDFMMMNVDHLYPTHIARMINETPDGIWGVCDFDRPLIHDDMKVLISGNLNQNPKIRAISKGLEAYDGGYCGMTVVRGPARQAYLSALDAVVAYGRDQAVVEEVLAELIQVNHPPNVLDISGTRWLEIDTPEDLSNAERILRMKPRFLD